MTITPATHAISINPATGEQLSVLLWAGANDIENALSAGGSRLSRLARDKYRLSCYCVVSVRLCAPVAKKWRK
ncbi:hypothetical protein N5V81_09790 [Escherichia coli]|nr:hypothetical protein [Escherichia coli]